MKTNDLFKLLPEEIQYDIDMTLYYEFNNDYCTVEEYMDEIYSRRDLIDLKRAETKRKRELTIEVLLKLVEEAKEKLYK